MLPYLKADNGNSKKYVVAFKGLNMGEGREDGEMSECLNLSSELYPCVSQRRPRTLLTEFGGGEGVTMLSVHGKLFVIHGTSVYYGDSVYSRDRRIAVSVEEGRKQVAVVGDLVCIFPDKVWVNAETLEYGRMDASYTADGAVFTDSTIVFGLTDTQEPVAFRPGDALTISGCTAAPENNKTIIVREVSYEVDKATLTVYENTLTEAEESGQILLRREVPDMDVVCESNNRLWGAKDGNIYASKFGDPLNFNVFDGLSSDSYAIEVTSEGRFTGAIAYSSYVCFFKEHCLHKVYGTKPSNFQLVTNQVHGVQAGSERSLCNVNETLLYKGVGGVYAYNGGIPELVSERFGTVRFAEACAASDGDRYYISMRNGDTWHLMVYDMLRGIWLEEDSAKCLDMTFSGGHVYLLFERNQEGFNDGQLYRIEHEGNRGDAEWSMTLCPFNETVNERKGCSKFHVRLELSAGAWLKMEVKRDNDLRWKQVYITHNPRQRTITVPILPERCDSVQIRISGKGECIIRSFVREFFTGSDV